MTPWLFVCLFLAARAARQAWLRGSLLARWRSLTQTWEGKLSELLGCGFCLSYHVPYLAIGILYVPGLVIGALTGPEWAEFCWLPLYSLALSGALVTLDELLSPTDD